MMAVIEKAKKEAAGFSCYGQQVHVGKEEIIAVGHYVLAIWEEQSQWQF